MNSPRRALALRHRARVARAVGPRTFLAGDIALVECAAVDAVRPGVGTGSVQAALAEGALVLVAAGEARLALAVRQALLLPFLLLYNHEDQTRLLPVRQRARAHRRSRRRRLGLLRRRNGRRLGRRRRLLRLCAPHPPPQRVGHGSPNGPSSAPSCAVQRGRLSAYTPARHNSAVSPFATTVPSRWLPADPCPPQAGSASIPSRVKTVQF